MIFLGQYTKFSFKASNSLGLYSILANKVVLHLNLNYTCRNSIMKALYHSRPPLSGPIGWNYTCCNSVMKALYHSRPPLSGPVGWNMNCTSQLKLYTQPMRMLSTSTCHYNQYREQREKNKHTTLYYMAAMSVLVVGLAYAAVPLYRMFCQAYSYGGTVQRQKDGEKIAELTPVKHRKLTIQFTADTAAMVWNFRPEQNKIELSPGETALAFYTATNPTDRPVIGVSTYNVLPYEVGQYFNKIQCFCFEEQMLNPHEEVHLPVFFYIDPEFAEDPAMEYVDNITLSYTFFEAKDGMEIPLPGFMKK